MSDDLVVAPDGFLWYQGAKLPFKLALAAGGFEFFDKDKDRSRSRGTPLFVVPFEAIIAFVGSMDLSKQSNRQISDEGDGHE